MYLIRCRYAIVFADCLLYNALFNVHMFLLYQLMRTYAGSKLVHVHWDCIVIVLLEFSCKGIIENEQFFDSQIARIGFYWQKQVSKTS